MNNSSIKQFPHNSSHMRQLQWSIDWYSTQYAEAKETEQKAWQAFRKAVDEGKPDDVIETVYDIAAWHEAVRIEIWKLLDLAKAEYLANLN